MSHSNRHQFAPLTKDSKALTGQRLSRVIAKAAKESLGDNWVKKENGFYNPNLTESLAISVPHINADEVSPIMDTLMPHVLRMLADTQDAIISEMRKESGCSEIGDKEINPAACVRYLDAVAKGNRVTGEYLTEWFRDTYSLQAAEFIATLCSFNADMNLWTPDQVTVVEQKTNVLAGMFAGFASGKYSPDIPRCKAIRKFGEFLGAAGMDSRMIAYVEKAKKVQEEKERELSSDALGF